MVQLLVWLLLAILLLTISKIEFNNTLPLPKDEDVSHLLTSRPTALARRRGPRSPAKYSPDNNKSRGTFIQIKVEASR